MLKRIQKIINIGKFESCIAPACEFKKETIIFGSNTKGKSTLTSILRSLQSGNADILVGRKTFGATGNKNVEIDFDEDGTNNKYKFQSKVWNKPNPNILIFDSKFIADNIFDGENITYDHQKNLNTVIIGEKGQNLNKQITELQKQSDDFTNKKSEKTREFSRHFPQLDLLTFKSLLKDTSIEEKIEDKEKEIRFEQEKDEIKKTIKSDILSLGTINFSIEPVLSKTLDVKQKEIESHIKSHFAKTENAEGFLSEGLDFLKDKTPSNTVRVCIFCGQDLNEKSEKLISVYSAFFKGGYEILQKEINFAIDCFKNINIEAILQKISGDLKSKGLDIGITDTEINKLIKAKKDFEKELEKKKDLNYQINFTDFRLLKSGIEKIKLDLENLEQSKLNITSAKTILELNLEKKAFEATKSRHEPTWIKFCTDWDFIETESDKVRKLREEKRKELEVYSSSVFDIHKMTINSICKEMGADFEVADFKPLKKIVGRDERIFAIKFFGAHKVYIDNNNEKTANFRNTLSESDKRLLAFAFFVSLLMHDKDLNKKIVIFDDPMSSFDIERRRKTIHHIIDIACKYNGADGKEIVLVPEQKIILTHEESFAKDLQHAMPRASTIKIVDHVISGNKRSALSRADFFEDFPDDDILHRIDKVKNILDTRTFSTPFEKDCRIILENIFKRKYYFDLRSQIEARDSVRTFTITLSKAGIGGFNEDQKQKKFLRLCEDLNIELHDNNISLSSGDRESILKDFFDCLKEI